eukprot:TRINITY_DN25921_c0_g1_i1.p1 TRINITY_DN25921_c0_g1~~TRINITY_DN25921_c0_g1_i1.p1  ORF type:complete len:610 (+),score=146.88 TRINITY_DN25921_c0_g1_i1:92-1921(+)
MKFLRQLTFWKSSQKANAVEPFQQRIDSAGKGADAVRLEEPSTIEASPKPSTSGAPAHAQVPPVAAPVSPLGTTELEARHENVPGPGAVSAPSASSSQHASEPQEPPAPGASSEASGIARPGIEESTTKDSPVERSSKGLKSRKVSFAGPETKQPEVDTRTPSPSEYEGESDDCVSFKTSLVVIRAGVSEAFGQMIGSSLQSTKWDKRSQALKAITQVLKGLDLQGVPPPGSTGVLGMSLDRDRTRCWRLSCQLLNHVMRDKVMPVRLAALELFQDTFADTPDVEPDEARYAAGVLVEHLINGVGDSNLRLHEAARRCILFAAERPGLLGLGCVLDKLKAKLDTCPKGGERNKIHFGVLDTVAVLLEHFPGRRVNADKSPSSPKSLISEDDDLDDDDDVQTCGDSWTAEDISPFIIAGMVEDSLGPRVRNSAVALAGTVFTTFGMEAMQPLFKSLRPAKVTLLKQKFKELEEDQIPLDEDDEDDGGEGDARPDLDNLLVCGSAMRPAPIPGVLAASLPGAMGEDDMLMDGILEETGMVFSGAGIVNEGRPVEDELEDALLEEELLCMGLDDLEDLDEQQALLSSLADLEGSTDSILQSHRDDNISVEAF